MASKNKNTNQNMQHDESNMELGEHQSGHVQDQPSGNTANQQHLEGQPPRQSEYQQGSKMSADEPAEGSRKTVEDDLKRQK